MISKLVYVSCDRCNNPGEAVVGDAADAREAARLVNDFRRVGKEDVCAFCRDSEKKDADDD